MPFQMEGPQQTPLDLVQEQFWRHTDRNPTDASAVLAMIDSAIKTLDGPLAGSNKKSEAFIEGLVKSLDPQTRGGMGLAGYEMLHEVGMLAANGSVSRVEQWGAFALLGLLAATHDPDIEHNAAHIDPAVYRAQLASSVARDILQRLMQPGAVKADNHALINAFINGPTNVSTQDAAIQLLDLLPSTTPVLSDSTEQLNDKEPTNGNLGNKLGPPKDRLLVALSSSAQSTIRKMTWIRKGFDFSRETIEGRDVMHDGQRIGIIFDLTVCNHTFRGYFVDDVLSNAEATDMCWRLLTDAVVDAVSNRVRSLPKAKVTTHCFGNLGAHDHLVRGYFVPLGTTTDGARAYGLVAALRTKDHQPQVLRMLGNFNRRVPK